MLTRTREQEIVAAWTGPVQIADNPSPILETIEPQAFEPITIITAAWQAGIALSPTLEQFGFRTVSGRRRGVVVAGNFGSPARATAELTAVFESFAFGRRQIWQVALWLMADLQLQTVEVRVAADNERAQRFVQRLGFKLEGPTALDDRRPATLWRMSTEDFFDSRWARPRAWPRTPMQDAA